MAKAQQLVEHMGVYLQGGLSAVAHFSVLHSPGHAVVCQYCTLRLVFKDYALW